MTDPSLNNATDPPQPLGLVAIPPHGCRDYLEMLSKVGTLVGDFYLRLGRAFEPAPLPAGMQVGSKGQCYRNAGERALESERWGYAEGFATLSVPVPVHHAWLVDPEGRAVDPTWGYVPEAQYFGVVLSTEALMLHVEETRHWGMLAEALPTGLVKRHPQEYLHPKFRPAPGQMAHFHQQVLAALRMDKRVR